MQPAVVVEPGPLATVMITRPTMCGNCGMCQVRARTHTVRAVDLVGARPGQQVLIDFPHRVFLVAALLSFGIPLAGLLVGLVAGAAVAGPGAAGAPGGVAGGVTGLAGAYLLLRLLDRRLVGLPRPVIVAICPHTGEAPGEIPGGVQ